MGKVTIYRFQVYNGAIDSMQLSRRWGTREAIEKYAHGYVLEETAIEVDESIVQSEIAGLTERGFEPTSARS